MMERTTKAALKAYFDANPSHRGQASSIDEINAFEQQIGTKLPAAYHEFLQNYGSAIVGPFPIFGLHPSDGLLGWWKQSTMQPLPPAWWSIEWLNISFRERGWQGTEEWLIFSLDWSGHPLGFVANSAVWISVPQLPGQTRELAASFETFLIKWCLRST